MTYIDPITWPCPQCGVGTGELCRSMSYPDRREMTERVHTERVESR